MNKPLIGRRIRIASGILLGSFAFALPGYAEVGLRVEAHPIAAPIDAYVRVTENGEPVVGLTPADIAVTLDGAPVQDFTLALPPSQDSAQKLSIVIVMQDGGLQFSPKADFSPLIEQLAVGDRLAVVKYYGDIEFVRTGGVLLLPFSAIDDGVRSERINRFIQADGRYSESGLGTLLRSGFSTLFDGVMAGISQFEAASGTLPDGPKVIVTVDCCGGRTSLSDVIARANAAGIPIFNAGFHALGRHPEVLARVRALAANTGGIHVKATEAASSEEAIARFASWLEDGYRISIPHDAIGDCERHHLAISVRGESTSAMFSRCDTTPEPFRFRDKLDAAVATRVRSNPVTITGIDTAVPVRVYGGEYSIGCDRTFTSEPGRILPGESVCVRHVSAESGGLEVYTLLVVGAESSWFSSSTVF